MSADTLTTVAIAVIPDTHNLVYEHLKTSYQTAHNQATLETPQCAEQPKQDYYTRLSKYQNP